jgi:hypothetical protein
LLLSDFWFSPLQCCEVASVPQDFYFPNNIFSLLFWTFVYLPWKNVLWSIFKLNYLFFFFFLILSSGTTTISATPPPRLFVLWYWGLNSESWTQDLVLSSQALYNLSYSLSPIPFFALVIFQMGSCSFSHFCLGPSLDYNSPTVTSCNRL